MKQINAIKATSFGLFLLSVNLSLSQGGNWKLDGNSNASNTTFIGSTSNQPFIMKTNNLERFRINGNGQFNFLGLGAGLGFLTTDANGLLQKTVFTGNANQVLLGNGTFGTLASQSYFALTGVSQLNTSYKLGIGVTFPAEMLEVNGNAVFNGNITAQKLTLTDVTYAGKTLFFRNTGMCMDGFDPVAGTQNEICAMTAPLFINSKASMMQNTFINANNNGNVGIGTISPQGKLDVNGSVYLRNNVFLPQLSVDLVPNFIMSYDELTGQLKKISNENFVQSMYAFTAEDQFQTCIYDQFPTWANGYKKIFVKCPEIKVGIGTEEPTHSLTVEGDAKIVTHTWTNSLSIGADVNSFSKVYINNTTNPAGIQVNQSGNSSTYQKLMYFEYSEPTTEIIKVTNTALNYIPFQLNANGQMIINNGTQKIFQLESNGLIRARKIRVDQEIWADFVFDENYKLMPITEVEDFVKKQKHLPNVPSEKNVIENGIDIAEMNKIMIQKIEELTLYLIEQNKKTEMLEAEIQLLKNKISND